MEERQGTCRYHSCHLPILVHNSDCLKSATNLHCQSHFSSLINSTFPFPSSVSLNEKPDDLMHDNHLPLFRLTRHSSYSNGESVKRNIIIDDTKTFKDISRRTQNDDENDVLKANTCNCCKIHIDHNNKRQSIATTTTTSTSNGWGGGIAAKLMCHVNKSKNKRRERDRLSKSCIAQ